MVLSRQAAPPGHKADLILILYLSANNRPDSWYVKTTLEPYFARLDKDDSA